MRKERNEKEKEDEEEEKANQEMGPEQQLPPEAYYFFTVEEYIPLSSAVYTCNLVTAYGS